MPRPLEALPRQSPLTPVFAESQNIHELQPGISMFVSYPGSPLGQNVFLLTSFDIAQNAATGVQINCPSQLTLNQAIQQFTGKEKALAKDVPILQGGSCEPKTLFMITSREWHPEWAKYECGPYIIHDHQIALQALADGDVPEKILPALGYLGDKYSELQKALQTNYMGAFAATDEMLFKHYSPDSKWKRAMYLHTQGHVQGFQLPVHSPRRDLITGEELPVDMKLTIN